MSSAELNEVLQSATAMGSLVAAVFFLRYWVLSRDGLFVFFSLAFALMGASWLGLAVTASDEHHQEVYLVRLGAFLLIIAAIGLKNRGDSA